MSDHNNADQFAQAIQFQKIQSLIHRSVNAAPTPEGFRRVRGSTALPA